MPILLAIKTFLLVETPGFLKSVGVAFAKDGVKAGIKRLFCRKKKDPILEVTGSLDAKMNYLIALTESNSNVTIREIARELNGLIASLHVRTAHDVLLKLREYIPTSDQYTLSIVDYALASCSRYINRDSCIAEYERAYNEMIGAERYDLDIIAGKLYCLCLEKNSADALRMAKGLKEHNFVHPWAWIPEVALVEDRQVAYNNLPDEIKANPVILSTACLLHKENPNLCVDIFKFQINGPEKLEYENIPVWLFNLSVLTSRYFREWNMDAFTGDTPAGPFCQELYDYSTNFIKQLEKTELGELSSDVVLFNLITGYRINKEEATLNKLKQFKASSQFLLVKQLSCALFLAKAAKYDEAKDYLRDSDILDDASIYNVRFFLADVSVDEEYAKETLHQLVERKVQMPGAMLAYLLMAIRDHTDLLIDEARIVCIGDDVDENIYKEILASFAKEGVNTNYLLEHQNDASLGLRPFMAIALCDAGFAEEALNICESCIRDGYVDFCSHIYFNLLKQTKSYSRLNGFLRKVREGGYTENQYWLKEEYSLAIKEEDFQRMLAIAEALYRLDPNNHSYFTCYLTMQYQNGHFDKVREMAPLVKKYEFTPSAASEVFNVLLLSDLVEESVDFLYNYIRNTEPNEEIYLLYHSACMNPKTSAIIRKEYETVEEGMYVHYKHNGEARSDIIVLGQRTSCMIGKKKGETVVINDRLGRDETYEVMLILNKYEQLLEEIYKAIYDGKLQNAFSFTIDDLTADGSILNGLSRLTGHDEKWQNAHKTSLENYKQGRQSIYSFFHSDGYFEELYNHLFGPFKVYNIPKPDFEVLFEKRGVNIAEQEFVLDLSSLILLYEIHLKFGIVYNKKFIVSRGITHLIDATIAKEEYAMPAGIYQSVVDRLATIDKIDGASWFFARLKGLKQWIEETFEVEQAHEMIDVEMEGDSIFNQSRYMTLEYQSAALAMRGNRVFVSEDMALTVIFGNGFPVADVNLFVALFHPDKYAEVSHFMVESDMYGSDIDVEYVMQQYDNHADGNASSFDKCRENLFFCPSLYPVILNFCSRLMSRQIMLSGDTLTVSTMLGTMFGRFDQETAYKILLSAFKQLPQMRRELLMAYRSVYPVIG